jgi:hypothetical protein
MESRRREEKEKIYIYKIKMSLLDPVLKPSFFPLFYTPLRPSWPPSGWRQATPAPHRRNSTPSKQGNRLHLDKREKKRLSPPQTPFLDVSMETRCVVVLLLLAPKTQTSR